MQSSRDAELQGFKDFPQTFKMLQDADFGGLDDVQENPILDTLPAFTPVTPYKETTSTSQAQNKPLGRNQEPEKGREDGVEPISTPEQKKPKKPRRKWLRAKVAKDFKKPKRTPKSTEKKRKYVRKDPTSKVVPPAEELNDANVSSCKRSLNFDGITSYKDSTSVPMIDVNILLRDLTRQPTRRELLRENLKLLAMIGSGRTYSEVMRVRGINKKRKLGKRKKAAPLLLEYPTSHDGRVGNMGEEEGIVEGLQIVERSFEGNDRMVVYRPKVVIDDVTERKWIIAMGYTVQNTDESNADNENQWNQDTLDLHKKAWEFIKIMDLFQGDRRFSPWYGSVVDSIVGVYLTQNVSDHLSSSAFMSLAARFPDKACHEERTVMYVEEPDVADTNSVTIHEVDHINDNKVENDGVSFKSIPADGFSSDISNQEFDMSQEASKNKFGETLDVKENTLLSPTNNSTVNTDSVSKLKESFLSSETTTDTSKLKKILEREKNKKKVYDWNYLRKKTYKKCGQRRRNYENKDSLDWEAVRQADVNEIAEAIKARGQNNILAKRIKEFLNLIVSEDGSIDLEWLRDVPPDKAKKYLLSINGLGLKSVECIRLLTLHHVAFPVDTNVARIAVRLGWVPLEEMPNDVLLHAIEQYPIMDDIQKYLWPRLCTLPQDTLYELHYQMITFGKVFCTKSKPNCNACPMKAKCKHYASATASNKPALQGPEEKDIASSTVANLSPVLQPVPHLEREMIFEPRSKINNSEPIIEEPASPEPECNEINDIEEVLDECSNEDSDEIPTIEINYKGSETDYMQANWDLQDTIISKALVALHPQAASIPTEKLKNVSRLRTEHLVYELPDQHLLLKQNRLKKRVLGERCKYLFAIWTAGETAESIQPPERCGKQNSCNHCNEKPCSSCNNIREENSETVRGTILIPCKTANRASFPLNGTYFQVNEVFADHDTSLNPINVPRSLLWHLPKRTVYFGASIPSIFKEQSLEQIQKCFCKGYVCVRGFNRETRAPTLLTGRLHLSASKLAASIKTKRDKNNDLQKPVSTLSQDSLSSDH